MDVKHLAAVFINNEPFNVTSYFRSIAPDLVSRFGSAEQGQTNLDLLKAETQKSFRGGMFQRKFEDAEKAAIITNAYHNSLDGNLYPTPLWQLMQGGAYEFQDDYSAEMSSFFATSQSGVRSWAYYKEKVYFTITQQSPNLPTHSLYRFSPADGSGANTALTVPTSFSNSTTPHRFHVWGDWLLIGGKTSMSGSSMAHTYDGTTMTASSSGFFDFATFNEKLYGVTSSGELHQITAVAAGSFTHSLIGKIGRLNSDVFGFSQINKLVEFNGALYIATQHGLYRYDGVSVKPVVDLTQAIDYFNLRYVAVFNGRLYYTIKNKLYKFDGTNLEMLQDFQDGYAIKDLMASPDRLWIATMKNSGYMALSKNYPPETPAYSPAYFCYNDVGFFEYSSFDAIDIPVNYTSLSLFNVNNMIFTMIPDVYLNASFEPRSAGHRLFMLDLDNEFTTTRIVPSFSVTTSDIDCGYPSVTKTLNGILTNYDLGSDSEFKVEASYLVNDGWTDYAQIFHSDQVDPLGVTRDYLLHDQSKVGASSTHALEGPEAFRKLRLRVTFTNVDTSPTELPFLTDISARYTIHPSSGLKWLLELDIQGADSRNLTTPRLSNGEREDRSATYLRKIVFDAYRNKKPILMFDYDWAEVKSLDSSTVTLTGTDFVQAGDTIAIQFTNGDWYNRTVATATYDEVNNDTVITWKASGFRGKIGADAVSSAGIAAGCQVRKSHAVYIKDIRNERYILDPNTRNDRNRYSDIPSKLTCEVVAI